MPEPAVVYTDGACSGNPGPGGWAWAEPEGAFAAGCEAHTTNQRMEITAAYEAAVAHPGPLVIVTDSTYVLHCFEKKWFQKWMATGWLNSQRKPVANRDLWEPFVDLYLARPGEIRFRWVKGHSGDPMNDLVDQLAVGACTTQTPRIGDAPPDPATLAPPDSPRRAVVAAAEEVARARDGRVPDGHLLAVFGHGAPDLGGYDENPAAAGVRRRLGEVLAAKAAMEPDLVVLSGLRLGAEMLGAEAARDAGVPYVVVLPYPDPQRTWSTESKRRFDGLCSTARSVVTLERKRPTAKADFGKALARRDGWLAANAAEVVLVWDGVDPLLGDLHRKLLRHVDEADVWLLAP